MRTHLLWLFVMLLATGSAAFQSQIKEVVNPEQPVSKSINFTVYTDKNYAAPVYKDALAELHITITKVARSSRTIVWDKTYKSKQLHDYPSLQDARREKVVINNIADSKEQLEVKYTLTYNSKGSVLQVYNGTVFTPGTQNGQLYINL